MRWHRPDVIGRLLQTAQEQFTLAVIKRRGTSAEWGEN